MVREGVKRTNVRSFVAIAAQTGQGQVGRIRGPAVLRRDDVIGLVTM
jgi:hypothetical protein